ncbi:MAG: hypothetical protein KAS32_05325 [Candidatus Peribacteraceae bacterium]|nr:hypothetical protein [Candidatus Peribacteraceae bacterium]
MENITQNADFDKFIALFYALKPAWYSGKLDYYGETHYIGAIEKDGKWHYHHEEDSTWGCTDDVDGDINNLFDFYEDEEIELKFIIRNTILGYEYYFTFTSQHHNSNQQINSVVIKPKEPIRFMRLEIFDKIGVEIIR